MRSRYYLMIVGSFLGIILFSLIIYWANYFKCYWQWGDSGMDVRFLFGSGCQLSENDGKNWFPEKRYRVVD